MNRLLKFTAFVEAATGLLLMSVPNGVVHLLLGGEISGASISLGRVAGFGLLALGMACWPGNDSTSNTTSALRAMLTYNALATVYLLGLGLGGASIGILLWPAVGLHGILSLLLARQWHLGNTERAKHRPGQT